MTFHLPRIPYRCIACGDCCREPWALRIDPEAIARLEKVDWERHCGALPPGGEEALFSEGGFRCFREQGKRKVLPRVNGRCVFLEEEDTCFLHRTFGGDTKPNACIEFPYAFVETPAGVFAGLSFVCRSVREAAARAADCGSDDSGSLETAAEGAFTDLEEAYRRSNQDPERRRTLPESLRLQEGISLTWEDYLLVENGLAAVLGAPGRTLNDRLVAGEVFLGLLADYLQAMDATEDGSDRGRLVAHYVDSMRSEQGERVFRIAAKIRPNERVRQIVTSLFSSFAKASECQHRSARLHGLRLGCRWLCRLARDFFHSTRQATADPVEETILTSYVQHVVWRKGLLVGASPYFTGVIRRGYAHLLVTVALVREQWAVGMSSQSSREALLDALRVVERDFVLHGAQRSDVPVQELIGRYRFPLHLLDNLTHRRFFARSMVG